MKSNAVVAALAGVLLLPGCMSTLTGGGGSVEPASANADPAAGLSPLQNLLRFGTTEPPPMLEPPEEPIDCPLVVIAPGGAAVRLGGAESMSVRSQITLTEVARECARTASGDISVRVGAEGRVLQGPAGSTGGQYATLRIQLVRNGQTLLTRNARVGAAIPRDAAQADWIHVEPAFVVPPGPGGDVDVVLSLSPGGAAPARRGR